MKLSLLALAAPLALLAALSSSLVVPSSAANVSLSVNAAVTPRQVSADLWGVFFEELNHAGEGGLYAQEIQNTAFESKMVTPWTRLPADGVTTDLSISTAVPVTVESPHALQVSTTGSGSSAVVGVQNPGWWGISTVNHTAFNLDMWAYSATITSITASLHSADRSTVYATVTLSGVGKQWTRLNATLSLKGAGSDPKAVFSLSWTSGGGSDSIFFDVVTLFPAEGWHGLPFIRGDLADMIAAVHPSIIRLPGGSYVDGVNIAGRFEWNNTLYGHEHRPGHPNLWGYWGEDGLGIYEFFSWAEKLTDIYGNPTRVVWVVNAGISYGGEVITPEQLDGWIQDAINSVEFATGPASSTYGAIRAQMGHPEPFELHYMAIGNENCQGAGAPTYLKYYPTFYAKVKAAYPDLNLIANCNEKGLGTFDLWDYHTYPSPNQMYGMGHTFDNMNRSELIFVSEYAARGGDAANGTLDAALSEAVFMNGMEVNADVVHMATYAPLFANANAFEWIPDAIYFTSSQVYGTPSYWTQVMYANAYEGMQAPPKTVQFKAAGNATGFSASVTVGQLTSAYGGGKGGANTVYAVRLVNTLGAATTVSVDMQGVPSGASFPAPSDLAVLASPTSSRTDMNTFEHVRRVAPAYSTVDVKSASFSVELPPFSISTLRVYVNVPSSGKAAAAVAAAAATLIAQE